MEFKIRKNEKHFINILKTFSKSEAKLFDIKF